MRDQRLVARCHDLDTDRLLLAAVRGGRPRHTGVLRLVGGSLVVVFALAGCAGGRDDPESGVPERFVTLARPHVSPSGKFTASMVAGPVENSVPTRIVVVSDAAGKEFFHDTEAYSLRHRITVTWLSTKDQLWLDSGDVGRAFVEAEAGTWRKTYITPETVSTIPKEIQDLRGGR
jgi:hypothetical protein